ncbi:putative serine protease inhibitor 4, serpin-4 [Blattamonas nauphoetae]|uniref:Serine protease inhibitor 4, serpin-4 n=1 Tax=Blattamonas nauphoetae TaxID=2049346 RepID=A0ABQ9XE93_9EUKA|nr:putative serine protease inhibitor 4, serpin-4 [Blattamonas nauphoetae]
MLLVNAIHFKHQFSIKFNDRDTFYEDFTWFNGQKRKVKMMHMTNDLRYLHTQNVSLVNLGYTHPDARMLLILPHHHGQKALEEAIEHCFDPATFESLVQEGNIRDVELSVPRFEMKCTESLKGPLSRLGMDRAFSNDAEFPHISPEHLTLDDVVHRSVLKVNEEGTEAVAVTAFWAMGMTSAQPPPFPPLEFKLNRPFIVVFRLSNDVCLTSDALAILDELYDLVQAAASPPQNDDVSLSNQTIPEESSVFMKAWAALDSFFRRVQNFRNEQSLQKQFNKFVSAYGSLPTIIKSDTQQFFSLFNVWWSTHPRDFNSPEFQRRYDEMRYALESSETKAKEKIEQQKKRSRLVFRNLQISIDSSIVPLHQTEIPNFEEDTEYAKPFNKAKYIFVKKMIPSIYHVVTGTPGIGKSAIRMPLITLTMSLGANEVKTARHGEPSFIFVNRNKITNTTDPIPCDYDEQSFQDKPLDPIGKANITINRNSHPTVHIERDTSCYTYDVFMCQPSSENEVYDPEQVYSSQEFIGQLTVPSIHHFPHFFKLFVNQGNQVENRLRGATWHIVDDFTLRSAHIPLREHVVLLASAKERWDKITTYKQLIAPIFLYNMPTLLFPEMINMFNAIPCPYECDPKPTSPMMRAQNAIRLQGMIPRDVFAQRVLNTQYRSIHSSSPQFDPMNYFAQPATQIVSIAQFEPQGNVSIGDNRIPAMTATTTPILARALEEEVNKNPHAVRCAYCGSLVTEDFPNHYCNGMQECFPSIEPNQDLIDLVYSNNPDVETTDEHIHLTIHIPPSDKHDKTKEEERYDAFVAETSGIPHKGMSSESPPPQQSPSPQKQYVEVTCTSVIPDPPDVYRTPFCTKQTENEGPEEEDTEEEEETESTQHRFRSENAHDAPSRPVPSGVSTQQVSGSPNALSTIIDAHCLWSGRFRMSCEQVGKCQYKPIKLNEQPYQSLMFDLPSVDITEPTHNMQYMLPAVPNASVDPLDLYPKHVANQLRSKRVEEESLWQRLTCMNPLTGMGDAVQTGEKELTKRPTNVTKPTHNKQYMLPAVPCARIGPLDVSSESVTDYLRSKRVEYEYFWQWLNRKNAPAGMGDALEADEAELSERIRNSGNENEKSRVTCLLARELLLRSRLSLHKREVDAAWFFFRQSKQRMVLNDTAEVEYELMLASDSGPDASFRGSDELDGALMNARDCFGQRAQEFPEDSNLTTIHIGICNENHFASLHNVPEVQKTSQRELQEEAKKVEKGKQVLLKPTIVVEKQIRDKPTQTEKESTTTETDDDQKRAPKRQKQKKDQLPESSLPPMPTDNLIP